MRSLRLHQGATVMGTARLVGITRTQLHALERGARTLRPENAALLLKAIGASGPELAEWGSLVFTLVQTLSLEELQQLNGIEPRHHEAAAS